MRLKLISKVNEPIRESKKFFRLRLVESKKRLNEDVSALVGIKITPADFIKLTTDLKTYHKIKTFIENGDFSEILDLQGKKDTAKNRATKIGQSIGTGPDSASAVDILIRALEFAKPLPGSQFGAYDPKKAGNPSLLVQNAGDHLQVTNHGGRARTVYRWMNGEYDKISATLSFEGGSEASFKELPPVFVSQFDPNLKVLKRDIQEDEAGSANKYIFVELQSEYEGSKLIRTDAVTSKKLFDKAYASGYMRFNYPGRLMFRLKSGKPEQLPSSKQELLNNFELVTDPENELSVNAASGEKAQKLVDSLPSELITKQY